MSIDYIYREHILPRGSGHGFASNGLVSLWTYPTVQLQVCTAAVQARLPTPQDHRNGIFVTVRSAGVLGHRTDTPA